MDMIMIDVTSCGDVHVGDEVILAGSGEAMTISVEEVAAAARTISYEIVCGISSRVPRKYNDINVMPQGKGPVE